MEIAEFVDTVREKFHRPNDDHMLDVAMKTVLSSLQPELHRFPDGEYSQLLEKDWNDALIQQSGGVLTLEAEQQILRILKKYQTKCRKREEELLAIIETCLAMIDALSTSKRFKHRKLRRPEKQVRFDLVPHPPSS